MPLDIDRGAAFYAGIVTGEGSFIGSHSRFKFVVSVGAIDAGLCEQLREFFGVGHIYLSPARQPHYDDEVTYAVQSLRELSNVIVPFMDSHLPPSFKRTQYEEWRRDLIDYWQHRAKRVRPCTVVGCDKSRRAKGLCRHHYYETYRR